MLERLADHDDALMEQLLEDIQPPRDKVFADLAGELRAGQIVPVFIGSAMNGNGILRLLKALRHEAPNVEDTRARLGLKDVNQTLLQVMKTIHTSHAGKLSVARVLGGKVDDAMELQNPRGDLGKVSGIYRMVGQKSAKRGAADGRRDGRRSASSSRRAPAIRSARAAPSSSRSALPPPRSRCCGRWSARPSARTR